MQDNRRLFSDNEKQILFDEVYGRCPICGKRLTHNKVLQLSEKGYLQSDIVKGDKFADKAIYSITDQGKAYFKALMASCSAGPVPLLFDFNVVITNLNKMDKAEALELVSALRRSIQSSAESNEGYPPRLWTRPVRCLLQKSVEERGTGLSAEYEASKRS